MEKIEYRAVIKYLCLKGNTPEQIKTELDAVYGDSAPSYATVKRLLAEFKHGRTSLADDERSGCLLYTSPSPRDQRGSRMPSSA